MTLRISILIPVILVISTLASSIIVYTNDKRQVEADIRKEVVTQVKLDITRLQNVLYNRLTENSNNIGEARLNISVTAMDPMINSMFLTDEHGRIIVSNRYLEEGILANQANKRFKQSIVQRVRKSNAPVINYLSDEDTLLQGYFPVVLSLESEQSTPIKRIGILYTEVNIAYKLAGANRKAAFQALFFAGLMLIVSLLVATLLHQLITKRLNRLGNAASQLESGNLDARSDLFGNDEIGTLGSAFDKMAVQIKSDILRRQEAEKELRLLNDTLEERVTERTKQLQEAQRIGRMGNWSWDLVNDQVYWSTELYRILGYPPKEIAPTQERFDAALPPGDAKIIRQARQEALSDGKCHSIDHKILFPNGEERWVNEEIAATFDNCGRPIHLTGTVQDITERKLIEQNLIQAKEEAEQASKAKSLFLSRMSHELRTPLNAILGFSQVLQLETITQQQQSFVAEISEAGNHLLALIDELLDLSRIESGRLVLEMKPVYIQDVVDESISLTRGLMENNQLQLKISGSMDYKVIADKIRLRQVMVNLLTNAAKFNKKQGKINVACESNDDTVKISVIDSGIGIKSHNLHKLFLPFERVDTKNHQVEGSGIGLALSKQFIELMNGRIGVDSEYGKGSSCWFELKSAN